MGLFSNPLERQYQREAIRYFREQRAEIRTRANAARREAAEACWRKELEAWKETFRKAREKYEREQEEKARAAAEKAERVPNLIQHVSEAMDPKHEGNIILFHDGESACTERFSDIWNLDLDDYRKLCQMAVYGSSITKRRAAAVLVKQATELAGKRLLVRECPSDLREIVHAEVRGAFRVCDDLFGMETDLSQCVERSSEY